MVAFGLPWACYSPRLAPPSRGGACYLRTVPVWFRFGPTHGVSHVWMAIGWCMQWTETLSVMWCLRWCTSCCVFSLLKLTRLCCWLILHFVLWFMWWLLWQLWKRAEPATATWCQGGKSKVQGIHVLAEASPGEKNWLRVCCSCLELGHCRPRCATLVASLCMWKQVWLDLTFCTRCQCDLLLSPQPLDGAGSHGQSPINVATDDSTPSMGTWFKER